jgi:hypothetical protein
MAGPQPVCEDGSGEPSGLSFMAVGRVWRPVLTELFMAQKTRNRSIAITETNKKNGAGTNLKPNTQERDNEYSK